MIRRAQIGRLWVKVENRGFCVRYWLSTAGGNKDEALVAFHGDIGGRIDGKLQLLEQARSVSDESLQNDADNGSRLYRGPYFWIARPGAFGSSGHHVKDRRTLLEIRIAMAALDAVKRRNGFKRFHLVGQSGGGHTVAGLVQLRSDIGCAVITSGGTSLRSMYARQRAPDCRETPILRSNRPCEYNEATAWSAPVRGLGSQRQSRVVPLPARICRARKGAQSSNHARNCHGHRQELPRFVRPWDPTCSRLRNEAGISLQ